MFGGILGHIFCVAYSFLQKLLEGVSLVQIGKFLIGFI